MTNNIKDIFCICNLKLLYKNDQISIMLTDIETNKIVKMSSEHDAMPPVVPQMFEYINMFIEQTNQFPGSILLIGDFIYDKDFIYWVVDDMCVFACLLNKFVACYIDVNKSTNEIILKDRLTDNEIQIMNPSQKLEELKYSFTKDSLDHIYTKNNYFNHGNLNLLFTGDLNKIVDNKYIYQFSKSTMFGDLSALYEELFSLVMNKPN